MKLKIPTLGKANPLYLIVLLLAMLVGSLQAFGDGIGGGTGGSVFSTITVAGVNFTTVTGTGPNLVASGSPVIASPSITGPASVAAGGSLFANGVIWWKITAPTIASGFGSSPTIPAGSGTLAFSVNVGTGGVATSGVITMPSGSNEWECTVSPFNPSTAQLLNTTVVSARTTTSITLSNLVTSSGAAAAWPASQILMVNCGGA